MIQKRGGKGEGRGEGVEKRRGLSVNNLQEEKKAPYPIVEVGTRCP